MLSLQGAPTQVTVGDPVSVQATLKNTGSVAGTTTFQYRIKNRVVATREVTLNPGATTTATFQGTVPELPAGTYKQGVFVGTSSDGLTTDVVVVSRAASFEVTSIEGPADVTAGDRATVTAAVRNTGNAAGTKRMQYRIAGEVVGTRDVTLRPGQRTTVTIEGVVPNRTGTYKQGVFVGDTDVGRQTNIVINPRPAPVFRVSGLTAPSRAAIGDQVTATATVSNVGTKEGTTAVQYRIDGQVVATREVTLAPDRRTTVTFTGTVPGRPAGTYTQGVFVGDTNRGQRTSLTITRGQPAFEVGVLQTPATATIGDRISVSAFVRNTGGAGATRTLEYRIGDRVVAQRELQLNAGAGETVTFAGTVPDVAPGTYRQGVFVRGDGGRARTTTLDVRARARPAAAFSVSALDAPDRERAGATVSATATVRNTGDAEGTTRVRYRIGDEVVASQQVTLTAGATRRVSLQGAVPDLDPGAYTQGVFVGDDGQGRTAAFQVLGEPRFGVSDLRGPTTTAPGEQEQVRVTVTNTGTGPGSVSLQYRIEDEVVASEEATLDAGASTTVTFDVTVPDLEPGTYTQGVFVGDTDRGQTTSVVVRSTGTTDGDGDGFTVLVAVVAVLAAAALAGRRRGEG